ncbi:MAG: glycosyltransferase [Sedimentisphaerales bacterium]|nr:glycosyltransferase [Sedimentisphaerales bacterium]
MDTKELKKANYETAAIDVIRPAAKLCAYEHLDEEHIRSMYHWEKDITIMVTCYNEKANIITTLETIIAALNQSHLSWEIIIIDDASIDSSVECVSEFISKHPSYDIKLKVRTENRGLAQNYADGIFMARGRYYKLISGDGGEPLETFVTIFNAVGKADIVIPYYTKIEGRSLGRKIVSRTYVLLVNFLSGHKVKYYNGGPVISTYNLMRSYSKCHGFSFQADTVTRLLDEGMSYIEVPVMSYERLEEGKSTAFQLRNFLSVSKLFIDLTLRRLSRIYHRHLKKSKAVNSAR